MTETRTSNGLYHQDVSYTPRNGIGAVFFAMVLLLIGSLLYSILSWMWDDQRLPLSKIVLQGELSHVSARDVQQAFADLDHIGTFMSQDIDVLQDSIEEIPWVSQASLRKQWPDTVKVYLTEHKIAAIWNGVAMLDTNGIVFNGDTARLHDEQVKLYGPEGTEQSVLETYLYSNDRLAPLGLSVTSLVLNDRRAWQIILDNGIRLELGKDSLKERLTRFVLLYNRLGEQAAKVSYIDLRYDTGASVGWYREQELEQESTDD